MPLDINYPVLIVSGASGVGKNTVLDLVLAATGCRLCPSLTTRAPRPEDRPGKYMYVTHDEFEKRQHELLEAKSYAGNWYGSFPPDPKHIMEIELQGAREVLELIPTARLLFLVPPGRTLGQQLSCCLQRMKARDGQVDTRRLERARIELMEGPRLAHRVVVNHDNGQQQAADEIVAYWRSLQTT